MTPIDNPTIPYGYCHCGCGETTNISPKNNTSRGYVKGQPFSYVAGHWLDKATAASNVVWSRLRRPPTRSIDKGEEVIVLHLTKGYTSIIDVDDESLSHVNWRTFVCDGIPYAGRTENGKTLLLHRVLLAAANDIEVDHINGDSLYNRRHNLRLATTSQNSKNQKIRASSVTGFKGIFHQPSGKWTALIGADYKKYYLGSYPSAESAAMAYDEAAKRLHGEFAHLNFPENP